MKKVFLGALLAGVAAPALAADLPSHKPAPPVAYAPPPVFSWTGFYVGANGMYDWGSVHGGHGLFENPTGGMGGVTAGYNYQIGQFVTGLEGDLDWGDVSGRKGIDATGSYTKTDMTAFGTVRARAGIALDRALLFVTGGYAGGDVHSAIFDSVTPAYASTSSWQNGYAVGGGLEYAFSNNISAKAEYLFSQLQGQGLSTPTYSAKPGLDISMIRAGINYHF
jgi:outer membrane immunogenic protein